MSIEKVKKEIDELKSFIANYPRQKGRAYKLLEENLERKSKILLALEDQRSPLAKKLNL